MTVDVAEAVKDPVARLGGAFMLSAQAKAAGKAAGLRGWQMYFVGRAGVLGDVDADVVTAGLGFFPPDAVRAGWTAAREQLSPGEAAQVFLQICHDWGRVHLAAAGGLDDLAPLLERVVASADVAGLPLFAGWRATLADRLPDDGPARVAHLSFVLRELRGGWHLIATRATGLSPLESVLAGGGAGNATFFSWPEPYPDVSHLAEARAEAEALTSRLAAPPWSALTATEQEDAVRLLAIASEVALGSMTAG